MYLSFFRLKYKPFQISTDTRFLWLGEKHEEALATLRYGVLDNKGFLLLTGDVGTGKTTLINALLKTLGDNTLVATIRDPDLEPMDFYTYTAHAFGMPTNFTSKGTFLIEFEKFLRDSRASDKTVLLIIDEAQRISQKLLEEIRLLSNIEDEDKKLLNIFFVGQIEFNEILLRPENRPIRQRITVNYNIHPLTKKETDEYIQHRLLIAGNEEKIFEKEALEKIFSFSQGYPRLINIICDRALLTGFVEETNKITEKHVKECVEELTIPQLTTQKPSPQAIAPPAPETVATHSTVDPTSISLIRANAEKKIVPLRNQFLWPTLIGIMLAAFSFFFVFLDTTNTPGEHFLGRHVTKIRNFLLDNNKTGSASKTTVQAAKKPLSEKKQIKTYPLEIAKPDGSLPEKNMPDPEDTKTKGQNTVTRKDNVSPDEPATQDLSSRGTAKLTDNSADSDAQYAETEKIQPISLETYQKLIIPFSSDSSFPEGHLVDDLDNLAKALLVQPEFKVIITGYTDASGHEPYNKKLSEFRAHTVKSYLVGKGLTESRIIAQGFGSENPIASNETPEGRIANRRVEIELQE